MISETRERFLRAIAGVVPPERIVEIHFFPPIRQAGIESGVAVIAAEDPSAVSPPSPEPSPAAAGDDPGAASLDDAPVREAPAPLGVSDEIGAEGTMDDLVRGETGATEHDDAGYDAAGDGAGDDDAPAPRRFAVYMARYRLVLKGIDRGKWEAVTVAEADAPLITVETVVRGVQRRSGDVDDPERVTGAEARAELARIDHARALAAQPRARPA